MSVYVTRYKNRLRQITQSWPCTTCIREIIKYSYISKNFVFRCLFCSDAVKVVSIRLVLGWVELSTCMEKVGGAGTVHSATGDPHMSCKMHECDSSPFDLQPTLIKDHFRGTAKIVWNTDFVLLFWTTGTFSKRQPPSVMSPGNVTYTPIP